MYAIDFTELHFHIHCVMAIVMHKYIEPCIGKFRTMQPE